mmetsp:Transcript_8633/g.21221  ORF Transcript_8633/g.21221 Transcript_8633/m.21221 type:complete len:208 (+) Transcript_8633:1278-1901(+)
MTYRCILQTPKREPLGPAANIGVPGRCQWAFAESRDDLDGLAVFSKCRRPRVKARSPRKPASCLCFRSGYFGRLWPLGRHPFGRQLGCKTLCVGFPDTPVRVLADSSNKMYWTSNLPKSHPRRYILRRWPGGSRCRSFRDPRAVASGFPPTPASVPPCCPERCDGSSRLPFSSFFDCTPVVSFWWAVGVWKRRTSDHGVETEAVGDG